MFFLHTHTLTHTHVCAHTSIQYSHLLQSLNILPRFSLISQWSSMFSRFRPLIGERAAATAPIGPDTNILPASPIPTAITPNLVDFQSSV